MFRLLACWALAAGLTSCGSRPEGETDIAFVDQWWDLQASGWNVYFESTGNWYYALSMKNATLHWGGVWEARSQPGDYQVYDADSQQTVKLHAETIDGTPCVAYNFGPWYHDTACPYIQGD